MEVASKIAMNLKLDSSLDETSAKMNVAHVFFLYKLHMHFKENSRDIAKNIIEGILLRTLGDCFKTYLRTRSDQPSMETDALWDSLGADIFGAAVVMGFPSGEKLHLFVQQLVHKSVGAHADAARFCALVDKNAKPEQPLDEFLALQRSSDVPESVERLQDILFAAKCR